MAIRFCCPSCRKPLEVDAQLAGKDVLCFYCHDKVAVPTESDPSLGTPAPDTGVQAPPPVPGNSSVIGYVGLFASFALIAGFFFFMTWGLGKLMPIARTPGFNNLKKEEQMKLVNKRIAEIKKHPVMVQGSRAFFLVNLIALGFSIAGLVSNRGKIPAVFGLIISGLFGLLHIYSVLHPMG